MLARKHQVPGAQLAIHHGGVTAASEVGELEFGTGCRVTSDAAFPIGSITKCFTATVAMILEADGDVDPDAPIGDYVPELDEPVAVLSLRHLLSHTSGLAASPGLGEAPIPTLRRCAEQISREDLVLPPGTGFSYSNSGYALVGLLIETITGMSWAEALEMILLRPLDIEPALVGIPAARPSPRPIAVGHSVNAAIARTRPVQQSRTPADVPAGALAVSALDLVKLGLLHVDPGEPHLLPAACAERMRRPVPGALPFGLAHGWGLGLAVYRHGTADWVGHDGNADGTACYLRINPADGWVIALTTNASTGTGLWQDLLAELEGADVPIGPPDAPVPAWPPLPPPPGCEGKYINGDMELLVTAGAGGSVQLTIDGESSTPLTFHEDMAFSVTDPASGRPVFGGRFVPDPVTGAIQGMQVGGRFARQLSPARSGASR
jgi:CubicO group peptidase (beta-lactamase class C family)